MIRPITVIALLLLAVNVGLAEENCDDSSFERGQESSQCRQISEPEDVAKDCFRGPFSNDGHEYSVFIVAKISGMPSVDAYTLTYYSQYPDIDENFLATQVAIDSYLKGEIESEWRKDILGILHSLHGGKYEDIEKRRDILKRAIAEVIKNNEDKDRFWKAGLIVHALGDSYSHVYKPIFGGNEQAYGSYLGHLIMGHMPDEIARKSVFPRYKQFVAALLEALNSRDTQEIIAAKKEVLKEYLKPLEEIYSCRGLICLPGKISKLSDFIDTTAKETWLYDKSWFNCMQNRSRNLNVQEVQKVMDYIKYFESESRS